MMYDCDSILNQLSEYLDGYARETDLDALRQQARADRNCLTAFEAMLQVHALFSSAPVAASARDFSVAVTRELLWRQRRDKAVLGGILLVGVLTLLAPVLMMTWAGIAAVLQPNLLQGALSWGIDFISQIAAYGVAVLNVMQHMPAWMTISITTFISLSFLLLALAIVMQKAPEQLFSSADLKQRTS